MRCENEIRLRLPSIYICALLLPALCARLLVTQDVETRYTLQKKKV